MIWEQWAGLVERGRPESLKLFKLKPAMTKRRAPGPGAIRKQELQPIGKRHLSNKKVILHTDSAKAYQLKIPEVIHCHVVLKKKKGKVNGKTVWIKPHYTKIYNLTLPNGKKLAVKFGTQIIDRFWGFLRTQSKHADRKPRNIMLRRKIRSAQWLFWSKNCTNLWKAPGDMIATLCS